MWYYKCLCISSIILFFIGFLSSFVVLFFSVCFKHLFECSLYSSSFICYFDLNNILKWSIDRSVHLINNLRRGAVGSTSASLSVDDCQ